MNSFEYYSPTKIIFGKGSENETADEIKALKKNRVMIVYGGGSVKKSGLLDRITTDLKKKGITFFEFGGARANPYLSHVYDGIKKGIEFKADFILAVGGGSAIDTAKGISLGIANPNDDVWGYWQKKKAVTRSLPVGVVLTISAAGSETSNSAVLTNTETNIKAGLATNFNRPVFAIMNPELTYTLPKYQIACGIADIMMHTLERFSSRREDNLLTDEIGGALLRVVIENGAIFYSEPTNYNAASEVMWCGSVSHTGFTGLGGIQSMAAHQLSHELSKTFDTAHGAALTAVWSAYARYVCIEKNAFSRFEKLALLLFGETVRGKTEAETALLGIDKIEEFFKSIDLPVSIAPVSGGKLTKQQIDRLAFGCSYNNTRTIGNTVDLDIEDMKNIYTKANF